MIRSGACRGLTLAASVLVLLGGGLSAASAVPLPRERPASYDPAAGQGALEADEDIAAAPADAAGATPPLPKPRPEAGPERRESPTGREIAMIDPEEMIGPPLDPGRVVPGLPIPRPQIPVTPETPEPFRVDAKAVDAAVLKACKDRLDGLGVAYREVEPIVGQCNIAAPLEVSTVAKGVELQPAGLMNCATAEALARWTQDSVMPAARRELGTELAAIDQVSAFVCRTRYNRPGAKVSEHAKANAVDIGAFRFGDGGTAPVKPGTKHEAAVRRFQAEIRKESCDYFTTVLGPGSNAAHETHFHLDMAVRNGGYRLCDLGAPVANAR